MSWASTLLTDAQKLYEAGFDENGGLLDSYHDFELPLKQLEYQIIGLVSNL